MTKRCINLSSQLTNALIMKKYSLAPHKMQTNYYTIIKTSLLLVIFLLFITGCKEEDNFPPSQGDAIKAFKNHFGLTIEYAPIVFNELKNLYTSVVYVDDYAYRIYFYHPEGRAEALRTSPVFPTGKQKVLCVVLLSESLFQHVDSIKILWERAQLSIMKDHDNYAQTVGLTTPIVVFDNQNLYLPQDEFPTHDQKPLNSPFIEYANQKNINLLDYAILVRLDLDVESPGGGVGHYFNYVSKSIGVVIVNWIYHDNQDLSQVNFDGLAYAVYHHEVGHSWGWEHEWSGIEYQWKETFITDTALFGWTDLDGDGIVEIIDQTPYGK